MVSLNELTRRESQDKTCKKLSDGLAEAALDRATQPARQRVNAYFFVELI